jgi:hypothetical protein
VNESLWAVPRDPSPFVPWIRELAARAGAPEFAPHITLNRDAPPTAPFSVQLVALAHSDTRFRCITIAATRTPPLDTVDAPHLSLLYAELSPDVRAELCATVELPLPMTIHVDEVWRVDTSGDVPNWAVLERRPL